MWGMVGVRVARPRTDVEEHLRYMAQCIARREVRSMDAAAERARAELGAVVTVRSLTRRYREQRRDLEVAAMRELATVTHRVEWSDGQPFAYRARVPDQWLRWVERLEQREREDSEFAALAVRMMPSELAPYRNRLWVQGALLHLWQPDEMKPLIAESGLIPED